MNRIHPHSLGLAFGLFLALWHTFWAILVFAGAAQWLIDFIFRLHMITPPYKIAGFNAAYAMGLIALTALSGYVFGVVLGAIWNVSAAKAVKP